MKQEKVSVSYRHMCSDYNVIDSELTNRDFPGNPVAKTPRSQCRGPRFNRWSGNRSYIPQLRARMPQLKIPQAATKTWCSQIVGFFLITNKM